jgi:Cys-tRNA(Pro) deacylase
MSLLDKEPVKRVQNELKNFDNNLKVSVLKNTARTAKDASLSLNCEIGAIVKSLLFNSDSNLFVLCLVAGDKKCSLNMIKKIINKKDLSMASPEQVKSHTGFTIGGVSPIGHLSPSMILIDNSLNRFDKLYAAAGHPNCIFEIDFENLKKITNGSIERITE